MRILLSFIKNNQQKIALAIGYLLVASLFFALGRFTAESKPESKTDGAPPQTSDQVNNTPTAPTVQSATTTASGDCAGRIKGNISSSGRIYHMPGGAFYNRTNPEMCFSTEAEARAAGFRKSQR
ncbi:MAG: hypothetical protein HY398_01405 [Candidatus Doudnabacteria bacterium]|nr:hypothetical protein [Candidatus Doudnabacteria bacterium]